MRPRRASRPPSAFCSIASRSGLFFRASTSTRYRNIFPSLRVSFPNTCPSSERIATRPKPPPESANRCLERGHAKKGGSHKCEHALARRLASQRRKPHRFLGRANHRLGFVDAFLLLFLRHAVVDDAGSRLHVKHSILHER